MEIITKEGKDLEVLLNEICSEYNVSKYDFYYRYTEKKNGLFGKMSYLEKCLFISAHFKTGFSFLLLSGLSPLYVLNVFFTFPGSVVLKKHSIRLLVLGIFLFIVCCIAFSRYLDSLFKYFCISSGSSSRFL